MSSMTMTQKIRSFCTVLIVTGALVSPAYGQGTVMPIPLAQWLDNAGNVLNGGGLCVFAAGTSTLATTYTTSALSVANTNPIPLNSAGRPTSGGVFLTPGTSYKFVLKSATVSTCVPDTGTTIWSVDNVQAVPGSASAVDVIGTAGESIAAGESVYLSTGAGSLNAGQWYKTDSDFTYKSTYAAMVAVAPNAVTSGVTGSFRISGSVTTTGLAAGSAYFAGATAGALVTAPPTNAIRIGQAISATTLVVGQQTAPVGPRGPPCGRLTLTTDVPVTVANVTAATTLYYAPYGCNTVSTFDGTQWNQTAFTQLSIAVPSTTSQMYDVFLYDNAGVLTLELTAWTNDTTRATALAFQNGVYSKSGALTRLYLGSFRTTTVSGQTEDSVTRRYLFNFYNRVTRVVQAIDATGTWSYSTATWRQANAAAANQLDVISGVGDMRIVVRVQTFVAAAGAATNAGTAIGIDSTTAVGTGVNWSIVGAQTTFFIQSAASYAGLVASGRHTYTWLENQLAGAGTTTWAGTNANGVSGIFGQIEN